MTTTTTITATTTQTTCSIEVPAIVWDELVPLFVGQNRYGDLELVEVRETADDTLYRIHLTAEQAWRLADELVALADEYAEAADAAEEMGDDEVVTLAAAFETVADPLRADVAANAALIATLS